MDTSFAGDICTYSANPYLIALITLINNVNIKQCVKSILPNSPAIFSSYKNGFSFKKAQFPLTAIMIYPALIDLM